MYIAFTDGSVRRLKYGAYGYLLADKGFNLIHSDIRTEINTTISRMELKAVILVIEYVIKNHKSKNKPVITIYSDSMYVIKSVLQYISIWKQSGWVTVKKSPVANQDLMRKLDQLRKKVTLLMFHIKSHSNKTDIKSLYNKNIDSLVREKSKELVDRLEKNKRWGSGA